MKSIRTNNYSLLLTIITSIAAVISFGSTVFAQSTPRHANSNAISSQTVPQSQPQITTEQKELIQAQKANEEAQAEYYRMQGEKLREQAPQKSFWKSITENPAAIGAIIAATVALISLLFNYRTNVKNQRDTQFYEALKRFGDADSPTLRISAAFLLQKMGQRTEYFTTALEQFIAGTRLEKDALTRNSIYESICHLALFAPRIVLNHLYWSNKSLQNDLVIGLAEYFACVANVNAGEIGEDNWNRVTMITQVNRHILERLVIEKSEIFHNNLEYAQYAHESKPSTQKHQATIRNDLRQTAIGLTLNAFACQAAINYCKIKSQSIISLILRSDWRMLLLFLLVERINSSNTFEFKDMFLAEVDLSGADLAKVDLSSACFYKTNLSGANLKGAKLNEADLRGANLRGANLDNTKLAGARIDEHTKFGVTNWRKANFFEFEYSGEIDMELLELIYRRFDKYLHNGSKSVHPSVKKFLEKKKEGQKKAASA